MHLGGLKQKAVTGFLAVLTAVIAAVQLAVPARAVDAPMMPAGTHNGVASCAGSTCHGRSEPTGATVRQDEIRIWKDLSSPTGAHLQAYRVLMTPRSLAIASRLGIGRPDSARECLGCHAEPATATGPKFNKGDGVGCEACHGPSENWLTSHYAVGGTHAANVKNGLVALDNPRIRAENCLNCHFGAKGDQFVTHRIMAAGHPRVSFELDLFTALGRHWNVDADYRERKQVASGVKVWAVGQAAAVSRQLLMFADAQRGTAGQFPEFYFFDCRSCHRTIRDQREWLPARNANPFRPVPVGTPVFNDENLLMLTAISRVAAPAEGGRFEADAKAFHLAIAGDRAGALAAAARLRRSADALADRLADAEFSRGMTIAMLKAVLRGADERRLTDYQGSAQAVMAAETLVTSLESDGHVPAGTRARLKPLLTRAYAAVNDPEKFSSGEVKASFDGISAAVAGLQ